MQHFIEFWHWNVYGTSLIPVPGVDGIYWLDKRRNMGQHHTKARITAAKRGFPAYRIMYGDRVTQARPASNVVRVDRLPHTRR